MKLGIVLPFFGSYNSWFPYYLSTCAHLGPEVDVLILTDNAPPAEAAALRNVRFIPLTLSELCERVAALTGLSPALRPDNVYKICDYKPLYGKLFEQELRGYDFWAYGDEDIFFGNLLKFIHHRYFDEYDVISAVREMAAFGPLTLVRNTPALAELFLRECRTLGAAIEDDRCWGHDEGTHRECDNFDLILRRNPEIRALSLPLVADDLYYSGNYDASDAHCYHENEYADWSRVRTNWALRWETGKLLERGGEIPFFHFIKSKDRRINPGFRESFDGRRELVDSFCCSHRGLIEQTDYERAAARHGPTGARTPGYPSFALNRPGTSDLVDYAEYGTFHGVDSLYYHYELKAPEALANALGEGLLLGASWVRDNPLYRELAEQGLLLESHWAHVGTAHPERDFFVWAEAPEAPAIKLFYTAEALCRAGHLIHALKAYQAITVFYPNQYTWDPQAGCSWYLGPVALAAIQRICAQHQELGICFEGAQLLIHNPAPRRNDPQRTSYEHDIVIVSPGRFRQVAQAPSRPVDPRLRYRGAQLRAANPRAGRR